ncbi:hypothetical protein VTN31DRAFT_5536 [Thermomyces dupontii]|uniref:uncharacterized protein n=1 Tax=Talaromyces thermophilus TaxID=28565 RepID=UPI003742FB6A
MDDFHATAKWANRVLRPLNSLYHRLEKYRKSQVVDASQQRTPPDASHENSLSVTNIASAMRRDQDLDLSDSECSDRDPLWLPRQPEKRRIKHKYVERGEKGRGRRRTRSILRSPEVLKTLPGAIEIATPLITGKSRDRAEVLVETQNSDFQLQRREHGTTSRSRRGSSRKSRFPQPDPLWKATLDSENDATYVDIIRRLDTLFLNFLEKTRTSDAQCPRSAGGSRSLLSTVMRRLPDFIAEEQRLQDELEEEDVDMADAYFTELEAAYGSSTKGWQPLREAVRSQGISLVQDMMQKQMITKPSSLALIGRCIKEGENDAAEKLLSHQLGKIADYNHPDAFEPWRSTQSAHDPIRLLHAYWKQSGRDAYVFDELATLISRGALPPEWMVTTPWRPCMTSATNAVSNDGSESASATRLLEAVVLSACGICNDARNRSSSNPAVGARQTRVSKSAAYAQRLVGCPLYVQNALSNLVASIIVALCGMHFVRATEAVPGGREFSVRMMRFLDRMADVIQKNLRLDLCQSEEDIPPPHMQRRGYVFVGHYLMRCGRDRRKLFDAGCNAILMDHLEPFFGMVCQAPSMVREISTVAVDVIRCCEKGERDQCRRARHLCSALIKFYDLDLKNIALFLGKIAVEVALESAETSQDPEDHAWAADIQEILQNEQKRLAQRESGHIKTPSTDLSLQPFRWEESIGEWIAKTPLDQTKNAQRRKIMKPMVVIPMRRHSATSSTITDKSASSSVDGASSISSLDSSPPRSSVRRVRFDDGHEGPPLRKRVRYSYHGTTEQSTAASLNHQKAASTRVADHRRGVPPLKCQSHDDDSQSESDDDLSENPAHASIHGFQRSSDSESSDSLCMENNHIPGKNPHARTTFHRRRRQTVHPTIRPGRPPKQQPMVAVVTRSRSAGARPVVKRPEGSVLLDGVPCSDDSDDELSFL